MSVFCSRNLTLFLKGNVILVRKGKRSRALGEFVASKENVWGRYIQKDVQVKVNSSHYVECQQSDNIALMCHLPHSVPKDHVRCDNG